jgi:hypothetical protein
MVNLKNVEGTVLNYFWVQCRHFEGLRKITEDSILQSGQYVISRVSNRVHLECESDVLPLCQLHKGISFGRSFDVALTTEEVLYD